MGVVYPVKQIILANLRIIAERKQRTRTLVRPSPFAKQDREGYKGKQANHNHPKYPVVHHKIFPIILNARNHGVTLLRVFYFSYIAYICE